MDDMFDLEKLKKDQEDAERKKGIYGAIGSVAQGFANVPTSHELLYGGKSYRPNVKESFDELAKSVGDPSERQAKLYQAFKGAKDVEEYKKKDEEEKTLREPNSQRSKALMYMAKQRGLEGVTNGYEALQMFDPKKILESEADFGRQMKLEEYKNKNSNYQKDLDRQIEMAKINKEKAPKSAAERLAALSGTDKARYDNAKMVASEINKMGQAIGSNDTYSMVGDNDYTAAERKAAEAYGRMQSGGAINKEEEQRFLAMLPRGLDSRGLQRRKLQDQYKEMESRMKTLGFSPEEAGISMSDFEYGADDAELAQIQDRKKQASQVAQASSPQIDDQQAAVNMKKINAAMAKRMLNKSSKTAGR